MTLRLVLPRVCCVRGRFSRQAIHLGSYTDIHNCLLLASVRTVAGAQGDHPVHLASPQPDKKKRFLDHM